MKPSVKKICIGLGAVAAGIGTVSTTSYFISKKLMEIALDRKAPKLMEKGQQRLNDSNSLKVLIKVSLDESFFGYS